MKVTIFTCRHHEGDSMRRQRDICAILIPLLLFLAGCVGDYDPVTVSATTAAIVGEQAVRTNSHYVTLCTAKKLTVDQCRAWTAWFVGFQRQYAAAHAAYQTAMTAGDISSAKDAADRDRKSVV